MAIVVETGNGAIRRHAASATLGGANQIAGLGAFTTTGAFALTDAQALAVVGPLAASSAADHAMVCSPALAWLAWTGLP